MRAVERLNNDLTIIHRLYREKELVIRQTTHHSFDDTAGDRMTTLKNDADYPKQFELLEEVFAELLSAMDHRRDETTGIPGREQKTTQQVDDFLGGKQGALRIVAAQKVNAD